MSLVGKEGWVGVRGLGYDVIHEVTRSRFFKNHVGVSGLWF